MPKNILTAKVVRREDLTDDLFKLWLEPKTTEKFIFKPGQYCTIGLKKIWRAYSIVSAPHEEYIELFVELVPDGKLTPLLHKLKLGDSVDLLPKAKGIFTFDPKYKNHVMVATVTGVVPYISILRDFVYRSLNFKLPREEADRNFYILQGASYMDEFGYYEELSHLEDTHPVCDMTVIYEPTISRPGEERNAGWQHLETGRVNTLVEDFLKGALLKLEKTLIYACGHPEMIAKVKEIAAAGKWNFKEERFWKG